MKITALRYEPIWMLPFIVTGLLVFGIGCKSSGLEGFLERDLPLHFDFGSKSGTAGEGIYHVDHRTIYDKAKRYGFLSAVDQVYHLDDSAIRDNILSDGVMDSEPLQFQIDLRPGKYILELHMDGGITGEWTGTIRANGKLIADTIRVFGVAEEGNDPPQYWALLRRVVSDGDSLLLEIDAVGQASTLAGISIFADDLGPLAWEKGELVPKRPFQAPNAKMAIDLINNDAPKEALRVVSIIPEGEYRYEKALLILAIAGHLDISEPRPLIEWAGQLLYKENEVNSDPSIDINLHITQLYTQADDRYKRAGWDWAKNSTGFGIFDNLDLSGRALEEITQLEEHPLYYRALWNIGKLAFWSWVEEHSELTKAKADENFSLLLPRFPEHRLLRMYSGEQLLPLGEIPNVADDPEAPEWARKTAVALKALEDLIHYWVINRQSDTGEFGGKYDDDVEMLRWWPVARLAADDTLALLGLQRLVDGIWNSDWIEKGFSAKLRDVEHAAEPVADTQPMMIGYDYGNPIYVERCMESVKGIRDLWTGINQRGHRHFKTSWYSATELDTTPPKDCDVPLNTRTVKALRWLAWYNRHPFAMQFMREWSDAWLEDSKRTDKGKPYGIVPAAVRYNDDAIGGHADNWHHPGLFWHYYNFSGGNKIMRQLLATYDLTGDSRYLEPIEIALELVSKYSHRAGELFEVGTEGWVANLLYQSQGFAETVETWRLLTGNPGHDKLIEESGSPYLKFRLTGDEQYLVVGSQRIADGILYNRDLLTTEGYFTDRIEIGNLHTNEVLGASHLEAMYTGAAVNDGFYPFYSVSWNGLSSDFAAVVLETDRNSLSIKVYSFAEQQLNGSISLWRLDPGSYEFTQGPDFDGDGRMDQVTVRSKFEVSKRSTTHSISLPTQSVQLINVRQLEARPELDISELADLAIATSEIKFQYTQSAGEIIITIPVHNIGIVDAQAIDVAIIDGTEAAGKVIATGQLDRIEAPLDLEPRIVEIKLQVTLEDYMTGEWTILVDPQDNIPEITDLNNRVVLTAPSQKRELQK